jgi:CelD/BcsL family acetyltransferase involved in cellulose biosynthesis
MKVSVVRPQELIPTQIENWNDILQIEKYLSSPYFRPEFTLAAAECIENVYVAIIEDESSKEVGYFPFQKNGRLIGGPVGGRLSDYQAVIIKSSFDWDVYSLIKECGLSVWDYDHLITRQNQFSSSHYTASYSPIMNLKSGFDTYCQERKEAGVKRISQFLRKERKITKELENLRVELVDHNPDALKQVFSWKSEQCRRTGITDFFNNRWARELVERIFDIHNQDFSGILSTIYDGEKIVAAHIKMRTKNVLHYWFPTYNYEYSKYSPGAVLLLCMARELSKEHIEYIDLGKGDDVYKASFANDRIDLAEGSVLIPSLTAYNVAAKRRFRKFLRNSAILSPARKTLKYLKNCVMN